MLEEMCRLCLSKEELKPIFTDVEQSANYTTILTLVTGLRIQANDGLPQKICDDCTNSVNGFLKFRNQAHDSEVELLKLGLKHTEPAVKEENESGNNDSLDNVSADCYDFKRFKIEVELNRITQDADEDVEFETVQPKKKSRKEMRQLYLNLVEGDYVPNEPVKCEICKKSFNKWSSFTNHARKHLENENEECLGISQITQDKNDEIKESLEILQPSETELVKPKKKSRKEMRKLYLSFVEGELDPNGPVKCKICKKNLSKWNSFINHARKHLGFKFVCETRENISEYSRSENVLSARIFPFPITSPHRGARRFNSLLLFCGKSCVNSYDLKRHCRSFHGMARELKCKLCNYLALDTPQLKVHERRVHTGDRPFVCDLCGAAYFSRKCLLQHIESHRTTASVQCDKCSMTFKSRRHLAKHVYGTHSEKRRERRRERRQTVKDAT